METVMLKDTETRMYNAKEDLIGILREYGAGEYAPQVAALYIHLKAVKLDVNISKYKFHHGALLDDNTIKAAIDMVKDGHDE